MFYERARDIEHRLKQTLNLIREGKYSTPTLAERLGVSVPTVSRCITALRQRGYAIRSVKRARQWAFELVSEPAAATPA